MRAWTRRGLALSFGLGIALASGAWACAPAEGTGAAAEDYTREGKVQLLVTVDWEGRDLAPENIAAMANLHARFPGVKIVHFLNAAYYTKPGADADAVTRTIASVVGPKDERGLHIHGWKSLVEASGVTFDEGPTFWGNDLPASSCREDCGHEVPMSNYATADLRKIVKFSLDTLEQNGFGRAQSFRCGGWMAKPNVREALAAEGLRYDQSAVPTQFLAKQLAQYPIYDWLDELWAGTGPTSQPSTLETAAGELVEIPDNGALADYVDAEQMFEVYEANKADWLRDRRKTVVVSIGFHQETAARFLPRLEAALTRIQDDARESGIPLESVTSEATPRPAN